MVFEDNIKKHNLTLPNAADPVGSYVAAKIVGKILYISGQISINNDGKLITGKLGKDLDTDAGYQAAKRQAQFHNEGIQNQPNDRSTSDHFRFQSNFVLLFGYIVQLYLCS